MVQRIGGNRRKTRNKLSKHPKDKGKINIRRFMQTFEAGDKVGLKADPSVISAMYPPRYHGKTAVVKGKRGWCYEVIMKDDRKNKMLIVHPAHLKRL